MECPVRNRPDKAPLACDELTGFIGACCFVRPTDPHLTPPSVKRISKDKSFAAKVDREEVRAGVELLGWTGRTHPILIDALKPHAAELGLNGRGRDDLHITRMVMRASSLFL